MEDEMRVSEFEQASRGIENERGRLSLGRGWEESEQVGEQQRAEKQQCASDRARVKSSVSEEGRASECGHDQARVSECGQE